MPDTPMEGENSPTDYTDWHPPHRLHRLAPGDSTHAPPAGRETLLELVGEFLKSVGRSSGSCDHEVTWPPAGYAGHPDWRERTHPQITQIGTRPTDYTDCHPAVPRILRGPAERHSSSSSGNLRNLWAAVRARATTR